VKVGSLFAGIGGFDLAASRVWGWDCVRWQVEIDPWCRRVLAKHWPDVPKFGDIRELTGGELEPVDIACGGFPCQPSSLIGERLGTEDDNWLWPEMCRIVSVIRPRWLVVENVPGLVGMGLEQVLTDLESDGYTVGALAIPACAVGAPHLRDRLWVVGVATGRGFPACPFCAPDEICWRCDRGLPVAPDPISDRLERLLESRTAAWAVIGTGGGWAPAPGVLRVDDGLPHRVDRLRGLGNAIVPQVAEVLFRLIDEAQGSLPALEEVA
jgi:DNA (cytosine-5)-methyltransferase 1